jgi:hypothetical protein
MHILRHTALPVCRATQSASHLRNRPSRHIGIDEPTPSTTRNPHRACHIREIDFNTDSLKAHPHDNNFDPKALTFFLWEGVVIYLPTEFGSSVAILYRRFTPGFQSGVRLHLRGIVEALPPLYRGRSILTRRGTLPDRTRLLDFIPIQPAGVVATGFVQSALQLSGYRSYRKKRNRPPI